MNSYHGTSGQLTTWVDFMVQTLTVQQSSVKSLKNKAYSQTSEKKFNIKVIILYISCKQDSLMQNSCMFALGLWVNVSHNIWALLLQLQRHRHWVQFLISVLAPSWNWQWVYLTHLGRVWVFGLFKQMPVVQFREVQKGPKIPSESVFLNPCVLLMVMALMSWKQRASRHITWA